MQNMKKEIAFSPQLPCNLFIFYNINLWQFIIISLFVCLFWSNQMEKQNKKM